MFSVRQVINGMVIFLADMVFYEADVVVANGLWPIWLAVAAVHSVILNDP